MNRISIVFAATAFLLGPLAAASAQTVDQLLADHGLLNAELDRCKGLGMGSLTDARCKTAHAAETKRFFGDYTVHYTPIPVQVYPNVKVPDLKPAVPPPGKVPNG